MKNTAIIKTATLASDYSQISETIIIFTAKGLKFSKITKRIIKLTGLDFKEICKIASFEGEAGQMLDLLAPANLKSNRLLVVGKGEAKGKDKGENDLENLGGFITKQLKALKIENAIIIADEKTEQEIAQIGAGIILRHYEFDKYKSKSKKKKSSSKIKATFHVENKTAANKAVSSALATVSGTLLARDLINEPPNKLGPVEFAKKISELENDGIEVEILKPAELNKLKMGALMAVAQGSVRPARLAIMRYNGGKKSDKPIAFIGKGVVFDTGGISIKPAGLMEEMKGDMGGAAAVVGLMKAIALRKAKVNIVAVVGLVENMPDGNAYRPGDIVTSMSGQTIEVINTDAEGRLVLADALYYTNKRFKPKFMINLATLTGAIMVGLGQEYAGLFSNDDDLAKQLYDAGIKTDEKLWRMPLGKAYDKLIDSRFADMKNTGGRYGGATTAAQFLARFVGDTPWAHLDIAGTAFATKPNEINVSWASGFGVKLLDRFIKDNFES